jgi:RNA-directed DNA polymerase
MRMTTELTRFTQWAAERPQKRYTALMGMLTDEQGLAESFARQPLRKAVGVDGIGKVDYERELAGNLADLSARLKRMGYRPKPSRRVYVPKANGGKRPIGVPCFEDRIVEDRLSRILQAIWEPQFRDSSYGFRPGRHAHQALARLKQIIVGERTQWLVEVDIRNFFGSVSHEHMRRFVAHRVGDKNLLRLIQRFLKAGVLEDGAFSAAEEGTPQGNLVSPVLSNIYLHYCLDEWFERRFARQCEGKAFLVRYCDDFVACFEREADARAFEPELKERLAKFSLEVEPTKSALIRFGDLAPVLCKRDGLKRPVTFSFLGFTHYLHVRSNGRTVLRHKTQGVRMRKKLAALGQRLKSMRVLGAIEMQTYVRQHVQGHLQYYGVSGNSRCLQSYVHQVTRLLFKWLNRRSQRRSFNWKRYDPWVSAWMPRPRIVHTL